MSPRRPDRLGFGPVARRHHAIRRIGRAADILLNYIIGRQRGRRVDNREGDLPQRSLDNQFTAAAIKHHRDPDLLAIMDRRDLLDELRSRCVAIPLQEFAQLRRGVEDIRAVNQQVLDKVHAHPLPERPGRWNSFRNCKVSNLAAATHLVFHGVMQNGKLIGFAIIIVVFVIAASQATYVVEPGFRGVEVTLGKVSDQFKPEGFGTKSPFVSHIVSIPVRQLARVLPSECYSSDLQQVNVALRILYRIPEASVVKIYKEFSGDPFESLIAPRIQEALKEVTAMQSAEQIVKKREEIKAKALIAAREKIGSILIVEDIVLENITLSKELEAAIESKMVQEQEAAKARFTQQKAQIEADTAIIRAKGEAEAIRVRAEAIRDNPGLIQLQIVEKWDGKAPLVIGGGGESGNGANILLPLGLPNPSATRK